MKNLCRAFILLIVVTGLSRIIHAQPSPADDERSQVKKVVDRYMLPFLNRVNAPGAIVGVSFHGRRYFFAYGHATNAGARFTPTTLVEIGSCTKVFTTTLFALAIDRGQMKPDTSVETYMPKDFHLRPVARQMTPLQLADFTSGLPDDPPNLPRRLERRSIRGYTTKDFLRWISRWRPASAPPAPYRYSNAGIGLLGYLVAGAAGAPWENQLNQNIVGPLGMADTELQPDAQQRTRLAQGHRPNGMNAPHWPIFAWYAAGGLRSTALDMLRFGEANLGHRQVDGKPIPPELIAAMKRAQAPIYTLPRGTNKQGMAWVSIMGNGLPGLHPEIVKDGGTAGFRTAILVNHFKDAAIFIAVNQSSGYPTNIAIKIGRHLP